MARLNLLEETRFEKLPVTVYANQDIASKKVARRITDLIVSKQLKGENAILGLATGVTPIEVYRELVRIHKEEGVSFKNVITFNLDEYFPSQRKLNEFRCVGFWLDCRWRSNYRGSGHASIAQKESIGKQRFQSIRNG
jgi:hypothetical protein